MSGTVSNASIICMMISCVIGFAIPIGLYIFFRYKKNSDSAPFFTGCIVFLVFALILEAGISQIILASSSGEVIRSNPLYYALYAGLLAGLFEEFGRLLAFKTILKSYRSKDVNALMYGAGHGGFEAMMILGLTMINNIAYATSLNAGKISQYTESMSSETLISFEKIMLQIIETPSWQFLLGGAERIFAVVIQISLSVLVWQAAHKKKPYLFPLAILIHVIVDAVSAYLSQTGMNVFALEGIVALMAAAVGLLAWKLWKADMTQ